VAVEALADRAPVATVDPVDGAMEAPSAAVAMTAENAPAVIPARRRRLELVLVVVLWVAVLIVVDFLPGASL
jgi:hypothetical protein